jgi:hypothetical protein
MRDDDGRIRRARLAQGSGDASGETHCNSKIFNYRKLFGRVMQKNVNTRLTKKAKKG